MKTKNNIKAITKTEAIKFIKNKNYFGKGYKTFFGSILIKDKLFGDKETFAAVYEIREIKGIEGYFTNKTLKLFLKEDNNIHITNVSEEEVKTIKNLLKRVDNIKEVLDIDIKRIDGKDFINLIQEHILFQGLDTFGNIARERGLI